MLLVTLPVWVHVTFGDLYCSTIRWYFFCRSFVLFMSCVCHAFVSVHCCLVLTCWEGLTSRLSFVMFHCVFVTFPYGILGQVWYLIVSIPESCHLSYYEKSHEVLHCKTRTQHKTHTNNWGNNH